MESCTRLRPPLVPMELFIPTEEDYKMTATVPEHMTAVEITSPGGPEVLQPTSVRTPFPEAGQLLIKVGAAGVNRPDVLQRIGAYPPPKDASPLPGLEVAGTIAAVGTGVERYSVGDKVCALVHGGGYAQYCIAEEGSTLPVPEGLSMQQAACLPETFFTVWTNVFDRGGLKAGETFLVHGGSSGIGTTAIMLASQFGARVFATAGSREKCAVCEKLGAEKAINYNEEDFVSVIKDATGRKGANVILDMVGGDYIERNIAVAAESGRIVQIAFLNGPVAEVNFTMLMIKRLTLTGSTLRIRTNAEKEAIANSLEEKVWPLLEAGKVAPVIQESFPLADASKAHALMDSGKHIGKIVLDAT